MWYNLLMLNSVAIVFFRYRFLISVYNFKTNLWNHYNKQLICYIISSKSIAYYNDFTFSLTLSYWICHTCCWLWCHGNMFIITNFSSYHSCLIILSLYCWFLLYIFCKIYRVYVLAFSLFKKCASVRRQRRWRLRSVAREISGLFLKNTSVPVAQQPFHNGASECVLVFSVSTIIWNR